MARIEIEDLPVADNLTPEQEELIQGAGPRSFRPTLEALEGREMMDAGLGHGLQLPVALPASGGADPAGQVRLLTPTTDVSQAGMYRALAQLEALDGREMRDAGLGHGLQLPVARPAFGGAAPAGHVPVLGTSAPGATQAPRAALPRAQLDRVFADLGHQGLPQGQQSPSVQADSQHVQDVAEQILKEKIIDGSKNRWLFVGASRAGMEVQGDQIKVRFQVAYGFIRGIEGYPMCEVEFTFQGKNTGGVKRYDLVGAGLRDWNGFTFVGNQFEPVAKEIFRNVLGANGIWRHRFDENVFTNNVIRQAEKLWGAREGTFQLNRVERIDGGFKVLIYTDNNPFNPRGADVSKPPVGRGELWLTFKFDDAQLATGSLKVSEIRQGYRWVYDRFPVDQPWEDKWRDTTDASLHARLRGADWSVPNR